MEPALVVPLAVLFVSTVLAVQAGARLWLAPRPVRQRLAALTAGASGFGDATLAADGRPGRRAAWLAGAVPVRRAPRALALPVAVLLAVVAWRGPTPPAIATGVLAAVVVLRIPKWLRARAVTARRTALRHGLPDAIDLLIVCIESGSGLDQAVSRVAAELRLSHPALAEEFARITAECRAGTPRLEAFRRCADRTGVDEIRAFVTLLTQADRFGTSVGPALRTHAEASRTRRRQEAEERAAKLPIKLLFPLVFCLFPAFYVIVLGPSVLQIFRVFIGGALGQ